MRESTGTSGVSVPLPSSAACRLWIAHLDLLRPGHEGLLDAAETQRAGAFARAADRSRFVLGAAVLKLAVALEEGGEREARRVVVERTCDRCGQPHGRPRIAGSGLHVSVAHSGSIAAVALTRLGPVGVDVEQRAAAPDAALIRRVLAPSERLASPLDFLTYWCRKESVVKATGEGLRVPLSEVVVAAPDRPPAVLSYRGKPLAAAMFDVDVQEPGYAAALSVLTAGRVQLTVERADRLLAAGPG